MDHAIPTGGLPWREWIQKNTTKKNVVFTVTLVGGVAVATAVAISAGPMAGFDAFVGVGGALALIDRYMD